MAPFSQLFSALKASKNHAIEGSQEARLFYSTVPAVSFDRAFERSTNWIARKEERIRQIWRQTKARARQELQQLVDSTQTPLQQPSTAAQAELLKVEPPPPTQEQLANILGSNGWLRSTLLSTIGNASHIFMHHANSVNVVGADIMRDAFERPAGQALITVCNHVAAMDDPLVVASIVPPEMYGQPSALRWTLCASDRCFKYASLAPLFTAAKVLPVQRGGGLQQPGMIAAEARLAQGDWVHIFPEGTRSRDPSQMGPIRKGVGRLVAAAAAAAPEGTPAPLLIPFVHAGMEKIMPVGSKIPRIGNQVHVVVGEPIPLDDLVQAARQNPNDERLYSAISSRVEQHMQRLHRKVRHMAAADEVTAQEEMVAESSWQEDRDMQPASAGVRTVAGSRWTSWVPATEDRSLLWGPDKQKLWENAAFSMWHRVWASRIAVLQAAEGSQHAALA